MQKNKPIQIAVNPKVFRVADSKKYADAIAKQLAWIVEREGKDRNLDGKKAVVSVKFSFADEYGKALRRR